MNIITSSLSITTCRCARKESKTSLRMSSPVQESITNMDQAEYYDIMIIGHTGQGKSTTSDKLLIANREGVRCTTDVNIVTDEAKKQLQCGDMTLWLTTTSDLEKEETRLKTLVFARTDASPHNKIQEIRGNLGKSDDNPGTKHCEVFSNEVSKVRILDVPGFFDEECITGGPDTTVESAQSNAVAYNLRIMRKIIHIQTVMNMKFKRILYFLPVRGPLERASGVLQLELRVLTHYFGSSVIRKIVIVATNPPRMGRMPEEEAFPNEDQVQTMKFVNRSLKKLFPDVQFPLIPLIYISHGETCESILDKVFQAQVDREDLQLQVDPDTCTQCGKQVGIVNNEKVVFYINGENKIPNSESHCHPKIVPDIRLKHKVANLFIKLITLGRRSYRYYYVFDEICAGCRTAPGATRGCMQVGSAFVYDGETIIVDHKCNVLDAEEELLVTPPAAEKELPPAAKPTANN